MPASEVIADLSSREIMLRLAVHGRLRAVPKYINQVSSRISTSRKRSYSSRLRCPMHTAAKPAMPALEGQPTPAKGYTRDMEDVPSHCRSADECAGDFMPPSLQLRSTGMHLPIRTHCACRSTADSAARNQEQMSSSARPLPMRGGPLRGPQSAQIMLHRCSGDCGPAHSGQVDWVLRSKLVTALTPAQCTATGELPILYMDTVLTVLRL